MSLPAPFMVLQPLDTTKFYIILPDQLGHGQSSKPSDGLKAKFPRYTYDDMVKLQYLMLTEGLGVNHLRLVMGTSMGCMHSWVFLYTYPDFMDGAVPLACAPTDRRKRQRAPRPGGSRGPSSGHPIPRTDPDSEP